MSPVTGRMEIGKLCLPRHDSLTHETNATGAMKEYKYMHYRNFSLLKVYYDMINCLHIHDMWKICLMIMYWLTWINVTISMKSSRFKKKHATVYTKL